MTPLDPNKLFRQVGELEQRITHLEGVIDQKNAQIADLTALSVKRGERLRALEGVIEAKNAQLEGKNAQIDELEQVLLLRAESIELVRSSTDKLIAQRNDAQARALLSERLLGEALLFAPGRTNQRGEILDYYAPDDWISRVEALIGPFTSEENES